MNKLYINTIFIFICFFFLLHGLLRHCFCLTFSLFTVCLYCLQYIYIWKNTWCCIILVSETKDWRLFELLFFFCLNSCLLFVCCHTTHVCQFELCFYCGLFVFIYCWFSVYNTTFIRFCWFCFTRVCKCVCKWVSEWVNEMMRCLCVLIGLTKKLNK